MDVSIFSSDESPFLTQQLISEWLRISSTSEVVLEYSEQGGHIFRYRGDPITVSLQSNFATLDGDPGSIAILAIALRDAAGGIALELCHFESQSEVPLDITLSVPELTVILEEI